MEGEKRGSTGAVSCHESPWELRLGVCGLVAHGRADAMWMLPRVDPKVGHLLWPLHTIPGQFP